MQPEKVAVLDLLKTIMIIINSNSVSRFYCLMTLHLSKNYNILQQKESKLMKINFSQYTVNSHLAETLLLRTPQ